MRSIWDSGDVENDGALTSWILGPKGLPWNKIWGTYADFELIESQNKLAAGIIIPYYPYRKIAIW